VVGAGDVTHWLEDRCEEDLPAEGQLLSEVYQKLWLLASQDPMKGIRHEIKSGS
jgi:hypothetical protein